MKKTKTYIQGIFLSITLGLGLQLDAREISPSNLGRLNIDDRDIIQTCPTSDTFYNGNGGGTHVYVYSAVETLTVDLDYIDNSFLMDVDGTQIHPNRVQMQLEHFVTGDAHLVFQSDSGEMNSPWLPNTNGLPRVKIQVSASGIITLLGTRTPSSTTLETMVANNSISFNTISFPSGATTVTITNPDDGGADGISGTITANEICTLENSPWSTAGTNISYTIGNVGIGTTAQSTYRLAVDGKIHTKEVKIDLTGWADYVFAKDYELPTLLEVEKHIQEKGHLINIPSAKEVESNGIQLGEMNKLLLEKIEELTLYLIEIKKENRILQNQAQEVATRDVEQGEMNRLLLKKIEELTLYVTMQNQRIGQQKLKAQKQENQ